MSSSSQPKKSPPPASLDPTQSQRYPSLGTILSGLLDNPLAAAGVAGILWILTLISYLLPWASIQEPFISSSINGFGRYSSTFTNLTWSGGVLEALFTGRTITNEESFDTSGFTAGPATFSILILLAFLAGVILTGSGRTKKLGAAILAGSGVALLLFSLSALITKQGIASLKPFLKAIFPALDENATGGMSFNEFYAEGPDEEKEQISSELSEYLNPELAGGVFLCILFALVLLAFAALSFLRTPGVIVPSEWKKSTSANAARSFNAVKARVAKATERTSRSDGQAAGTEPQSRQPGESTAPAKPTDGQ